ncbi:MAG: hypothetical protein AAFX99_12065, partial [Myxococcota bacterium]
MNPYPWFLLLLLLAPTLGGCAADDEGELTGSYAIARDDAGLDADMDAGDAGDTEPDIPEDLTADQFASTLGTTLCTALFDSCCPSGLNPGTALSDPSTCQSTAAGLEVALANPDTLSEVAYDQDQARACLTSLLAVDPADLCGDFDSIAALPSPERPWFDLPGFASCAQALSGTAID